MERWKVCKGAIKGSPQAKNGKQATSPTKEAHAQAIDKSKAQTNQNQEVHQEEAAKTHGTTFPAEKNPETT